MFIITMLLRTEENRIMLHSLENVDLGKNVEISLLRRGIHHIYRGKFVTKSKSEVCILCESGKRLWIRRPQYPCDGVKVLKEEDIIP